MTPGELADVLDNLSDCAATCDGRWLVDHNDLAHAVASVEQAIAEMEMQTADLRRVLAWAKLAPLLNETGAAAAPPSEG